MLWNGIEVFNAEAYTDSPEGTIFYRFPKETVEQMGDIFYHKRIARLTTGIELRFVGEAFLTFIALDYHGSIEVFRGDYQAEHIELRKDERVTIECSYADWNSYCLPKARYGRDVWRVILGSDIRVRVVNIEPVGSLRAPTAQELPEKKLLAYGSSITHGCGSKFLTASYIHTLGRLLGMDVLNKGMGGSCMCEACVGNYIAKAHWDMAFLELGVNMTGTYTPEQFYNRASYIVKKAVATGKPVVTVSPYLNSTHLGPDNDNRKKTLAYTQMCERIAAENDVLFFRGTDILPTCDLLSADLVHPSQYGHMVMAQNLYKGITEKLG